MKNLLSLAVLALLVVSCNEAEINETKSISFEELTQTVIASPEWEDVVEASEAFRETMPSPYDAEARAKSQQLFEDFHNEVGDYQPFHYFVDNPEVNTPKEIEDRYRALIDFQEKNQRLREKFNLDKEQFRKIYKENRNSYKSKFFNK